MLPVTRVKQPLPCAYLLKSGVEKLNINQLAGGAAAYLTRELTLEPGKTDTLRFGLEIIFCITIKAIILFSLAYALGILPEVTVALFLSSFYRLFSGGAHCSSYLNCLSLGLLIYLTAGELGLRLVPYLSSDSLIYLLFAGGLLSGLCVILWAPGEVPFKKITKPADRILFKILSFASLGLWAGAGLYFIHSYMFSLAIAGLFAIMVQTFSFSPWGYTAIHQADNLLTKLFREKEVLSNDADG